MKLKDILAKVAKGEALTDEEKQFLASHDPDKAVNDAAAAARRKAEELAAALEKEKQDLAKKLQEIEAKLAEKDNAGKSDVEKAQAQIAELSKQMKTLQAQAESAKAENVALQRNQSLGEIRRKAGIQFVEGLDQAMLDRSFASAFEGIDNLSDETIINQKVATWKAMNKAALLDTTGHGSGGNPHVGDGAGAVDPMAISGDTLVKMAQSGDIAEAEKLLSAAEKADAAGKLEIK